MLEWEQSTATKNSGFTPTPTLGAERPAAWRGKEVRESWEVRGSRLKKKSLEPLPPRVGVLKPG